MADLYDPPLKSLRNISVAAVIPVSVEVAVVKATKALVRHRDTRWMALFTLTAPAPDCWSYGWMSATL